MKSIVVGKTSIYHENKGRYWYRRMALEYRDYYNNKRIKGKLKGWILYNIELTPKELLSTWSKNVQFFRFSTV